MALPVVLLTLLLAAPFVLLHRYQTCNPSAFHSDDLYSVEVSRDFWGRGYERTNWLFPYAPMLFPEQLLMLPCVAVFQDLVRIHLAYSILYQLLSVVVLTALFRQTGLRRGEAFSFACGGQLFLLTALLEPQSVGWIPLFVAPASHTGAILSGLFLWLLVVRDLQRRMSWRGGLLFILVGSLAVFSDRIVVGEFLGPLCLTVLGLALFRAVPIRKAVETFFLGGAAYGGAQGVLFLLSVWNIQVVSVGVLTDFSKTREALDRLLVDVPAYVAGQYLIWGVVSALLLLAPVVGWYYLIQARRHRPGTRSSADVFSETKYQSEVARSVLATAAWLCCICTVGALVVSGVGRHLGSQRLPARAVFRPLPFPAGLPTLLAGPRPAKVGAGCALTPGLVGCFPVVLPQRRPGRLRLSRPATTLPRIVPDPRPLSPRGQNQPGPCHLLERSETSVPLPGTRPDQSHFAQWSTHALHQQSTAFSPGESCLEIPFYNFILVHHRETRIPMSPGEIGRIFGFPRERVPCGDYEIWIYDRVLSGPFTLFLRSLLASRCREELAWTGPDTPRELARPVPNFTPKESGGRLTLLPDGEVTLTFATPVRGEFIDVGAEFDSHYHVTFANGAEVLGTVYVPRANFPWVLMPHRLAGIQSRLVIVPPAVRQRGWTSATVRAAGGYGNFNLSHFLVYHGAGRVQCRQLGPR